MKIYLIALKKKKIYQIFINKKKAKILKYQMKINMITNL